MLFISLKNLSSIPKSLPKATGIELRLDFFSLLELNELKKVLTGSPLPILLTLRSKRHGGECSLPLQKRISLIENLCKLKPTFLDLEWDLPKEFLDHILNSYPDTSYIISHHNPDHTPQDIESIYLEMKKTPAFGYKIATFTHSTTDALRLLLLSKKHSKLSVIPMGEKGSFARAISLTHAGKIGFAPRVPEEATAPGQLSLEELTSIYRYPTLHKKVDLYGLIGDPVSHSIGHVYHNRAFAEKNRNALYVKMSVKANELADFFPLAHAIGFKGLSVTMPLKEAVLPFVNNMDSRVSDIGASNTLILEKGTIFATNVDGIGALNALEKHLSVAGKKIALIGAGGSSKAIAFEAKKRGAILHVANRTIEKARLLSTSFSSLEDLPPSYDIIINTTSNPMPIHEEQILPGSIAMDITYAPKETLFLQAARRQGCKIVYGEEMFRCQAEEQAALWNRKGGL